MCKKPVTTTNFLIADPFSGFFGEDKLKAHPKKFPKKRPKKNQKKFHKKFEKNSKNCTKKNVKKSQKNSGKNSKNKMKLVTLSVEQRSRAASLRKVILASAVEME